MENKQKKLRIIIICLSVLLVTSLLALAVTLLYNHFISTQPTTVIIPDNIITPDSASSTNTVTDEKNDITFIDPFNSDATSESATESTSLKPTAAASKSPSEASAISLHSENPEENTPFEVTNMFPGDTITKYYRVRVSYKGDITVRYHADIRAGGEKLAEVLKVRITLLGSEELLYDGLMRDMPKSLNHKLQSTQSTQSDLYYEITAYLDTSVGNDYMDKELIADFRWWVEETPNLDLPQTGTTENVYLLSVIACVSLFVIILLVAKERKERKADEH